MFDSAPFLLIVGPLVGAAVVVLATGLAAAWRRRSGRGGETRATAAAGMTAAAVLWLLLTLAAQNEWVIYSRALVLDETGRTVFQGILVLLAVSYGLALVWPAESGFVALSLTAVAPLAAMVMIRPFTLGAYFLALAAAVLAMTIPSGRAGGVGAAWRYLVMAVLALPFFLLAGWLAETPAVLPWAAARVLAAAAILVLGGFPFVMWVRPAAEQVSPLLRPFLFGGAQLAALAFLFTWLQARPDWPADPGFQNWLGWSGLVTALLGGLLAAAGRDWRTLPASLLLLDLGLGLLTLLLPGAKGWETAVSILAARSVSLLLIGVGDLLWTGLRRWWGAWLWLVGCLSLLGLPLTVGFGGRWALLNALPGLGDGWRGGALAGLLLLAMAGGLWGVWRALWALAARPEDG